MNKHIIMKKFDYYTEAFKKFAKFDGRANLSQFWYFVLFNFIISIILNLISEKLGGIYSLIVLIPTLPELKSPPINGFDGIPTKFDL